MKAVLGSIVLHAALLVWLARLGARPAPAPGREPISIEVVTPRLSSPVPSPVATRPGNPPAARVAPRHHPPPRAAASPWSSVVVRMDPPAADQAGASLDGVEGGVAGGVTCDCEGGVIGAPPPPPPPPSRSEEPPASRARIARLVWPVRDEEVVDDEHLFLAQLTVDEDGDVVGVKMVRSHPGSRGDQAANLIWHFRYAPALDAAGRPIRSTFEQRFQIR